MNLIALKMLTGDRAKYLGLVFGIAFSTLLITQQASIFNGILKRTASFTYDMREGDIWVMDKTVDNLDIIEPMRDSDLNLVRSVNGVKWAVPLFKVMTIAKPNQGKMSQVTLIGVDDNSLVGAPQKMILGNYSDIKNPDAFIVDSVGYHLLWPNEEFQLGKIIEMNDRRAVLVGVADVLPSFQFAPIIFTRYSKALEYSNGGRKRLSFILVKAQDEVDKKLLAEKISQETNLMARTNADFATSTIMYYIKNTGIPINFGLTVMLGIIVGATIVGLLLNMFINDNIRQFGALKAMGVSDFTVVKMVLVQTLIVLALGLSIGSGMAALFFNATYNLPALKGVYLPLFIWLLAVCLISIVTILSSLFSVRRILKLDPAIVFK